MRTAEETIEQAHEIAQWAYDSKDARDATRQLAHLNFTLLSALLLEVAELRREIGDRKQV